MGSTKLLPLVASLLIIPSTILALPRPHTFNHRLHCTGSSPTATDYPIATGTGTYGAAAPTGYYPTGNGTYFAPSGSSISPSEVTSIAPEFTSNPTESAPSQSSNGSSTMSSISGSKTFIPKRKSANATSSSSGTTPVRGVNIGSWLVLEPWMAYSLFTGDFANATDQWSFDSTPGAMAKLQNHWDTWFTETDVQTLKSYGFNA